MKIKIKTLASLRQRPDFKYRVSLSLYMLVLGIFLLPNIAFFSTLSDERLIELTNDARAEEGLGPLTANQLLTKAALEKAEAIFAAQQFGHTLGERRFSAWVKDAGYGYTFVGENLAIDFVTSEGAMKAWLASPSHRENLINEKFSETGIAVVDGEFRGERSTLVVQIFGAPTVPGVSPAVVPPPPAAKTAANPEYRLSHASRQESALWPAADPLYGLNTSLQLPALRSLPITTAKPFPVAAIIFSILAVTWSVAVARGLDRPLSA